MLEPPVAFEALLNVVLCSDDVHTRWEDFTTILANMGLDQVNYGYIDTSHADRECAPVRFLSSMRDDWISHYGDGRMDMDDPHVKLVRTGNLSPYVWSESKLVRLQNDGERRVLLEAREAGLAGQLQVTLPDMAGRGIAVAGMALGSSANERDFIGSIHGMESFLVMAAHLFHQCSIAEIERQSFAAAALTPRERDCLAYLATGQRIARIAEKLGIAKVTAEMHLANVRRKLKASTLHEALARAVRWRMV